MSEDEILVCGDFVAAAEEGDLRALGGVVVGGGKFEDEARGDRAAFEGLRCHCEFCEGSICECLMRECCSTREY